MRPPKPKPQNHKTKQNTTQQNSSSVFSEPAVRARRRGVVAARRREQREHVGADGHRRAPRRRDPALEPVCRVVVVEERSASLTSSQSQREELSNERRETPALAPNRRHLVVSISHLVT